MRHQLELRHFRYFLAVAEELHYRKAAEKLFISQPGLSRQIKQMEDRLGTPLFIRDKKKVRLTAAGHYLKGEVELLLNHIELTSKQVASIGAGKQGELRIGFLGSAMQQVIPPLLLRLKKGFPSIHTSLEELSNSAQIDAVMKDKLDLGFVRVASVPAAVDKALVYEDTFSVVLPKNHQLNSHTFKTIGQLEEEDFILFNKAYSPLYYNTVMSICEDAGFTPKVSHKSVHALTIFKLVESGLGVAIVPTGLQRGFQMGIKFIALKNINQKAALSVIWKKDNRSLVLQNCLSLLLRN